MVKGVGKMKNIRKEFIMNLAGILLFYLIVIFGLLAVCNRVTYINGLSNNISISEISGN